MRARGSDNFVATMALIEELIGPRLEHIMFVTLLCSCRYLRITVTVLGSLRRVGSQSSYLLFTSIFVIYQHICYLNIIITL